MQPYKLSPRELFSRYQISVPLYQRAYVWGREGQLEPFMLDVQELMKSSDAKHFIGSAILEVPDIDRLQGVVTPCMVIDGQQRLTTLMLVMKAISIAIKGGPRFDLDIAGKLKQYLENGRYVSNSGGVDRYKLIPTLLDRDDFLQIMSEECYEKRDEEDIEDESALIQAFQFLGDYINENIKSFEELNQFFNCLLDRLEIIVIEITEDENAQEIFETINSTGAKLTSVDLIKNYAFKEIAFDKSNAEDFYTKYWKNFEVEKFWKREESFSGQRVPASVSFMYYWTIYKNADDLLVHKTFNRYKAISQSQGAANTLIELSRDAKTYCELYQIKPGEIKDRLQLFAYRLNAIGVNVVKPLVIYVMSESFPAEDRDKFVSTLESWIFRRLILGLTTKGYGNIFSSILNRISKEKPNIPSGWLEQYFAKMEAPANRWPDDEEVLECLKSLEMYRMLRAKKTKVILEAIEDQKRITGFKKDGSFRCKGDGSLVNKTLTVEHFMPQNWREHYDLPRGTSEVEMSAAIHSIGNLTLLTQSINSSVSNDGAHNKTAKITDDDNLFLNKELIKNTNSWGILKIRKRADQLAKDITKVWPVPEGHQSLRDEVKEPKRHMSLKDMLSNNIIQVGQKFYLDGDENVIGEILVDGQMVYQKTKNKSFIDQDPGELAAKINRDDDNRGGFRRWKTEPGGKRGLAYLRTQYFKNQADEHLGN